MRSKKRGFTLIELLVVVAIIALLVAILLPSLGKAKIAAQRSACAANVRAMSQALNFYRTEFNGANPLGNPIGFNNTPVMELEYYYPVVLAPYLGVVKYDNIPKKAGGGGQLSALSAKIYDPQLLKASLFPSPTGFRRKTVMMCPGEIPYEVNNGWADYKTQPLFFPLCSYLPPVVTWGEGIKPYNDNSPATYSPFAEIWAIENSPQITTLFNAAGVPNNPNIGNYFNGLKRMQGKRADAAIPVFGQVNGSASGPWGIRYSSPEVTSNRYMGYCWGYSEPANPQSNGEYTSKNASHGDILPFGYLDGHVEMITRGDIKNPNLYAWGYVDSANKGYFGRNPLWCNK